MTAYLWWLFQQQNTGKVFSTEPHTNTSSNSHIDIQLHDPGFEFREAHCPNCKDGIITEKYFDEGMACEYLESIGELYNIPSGVSLQAHIHSAPYEARKRGQDINFYKEKQYSCVHKYCGGNYEFSKDKLQNI